MFVLLIVITSTLAQPIKAKKSSLRKSCGRVLVERLDSICKSRGGYLTHINRAFPQKRVRRGIVDECCLNKCADHHMYAYCSNGRRKVKSSESDVSESIEEPMPLDSQAPEIPLPEALALVRGTDEKNSIVETTTTTTEKPVETTTKDQRYHFVIGTVPPEYQILPIVPSRSRIIY